MTRRLSLAIAPAVGLLLLTTAALAADDTPSSDASGTDVPAAPCQTDDDCPDGGTCVDQVCDWGDAEPDDWSCSEDSDCAEDEVCIWGGCRDAEGWCKSDEDCGDYLKCEKSNAPTEATPPPTQPALPSDGEDPDGPQGDSTDEPPAGEQDGAGSGEAATAQHDWGRCVVDQEALPETEECAGFCGLAVQCGGVAESGTSSSGDSMDPAPDAGPPKEEPGSDTDSDGDDQPAADTDDSTDGGTDDGTDDGDEGGPSEADLAQAAELCAMMCNYAAAVDVAQAEFEDVLTCIDGLGSEATCQDVEEECDAAGEAWAEAMADSGALDAVLGGGAYASESGMDASGGGGSGAPWAPNPNAQGDDAPQDGALGTGSSDSAGGASGESAASGGGDGGCHGGGGPATPVALLLALLAVVALGRRHRAA